MIREFKKINVVDSDLTKVQGNVQEYLRPITQNPLLDGLRIENVDLASASTTNIEHNLGRVPLGWIVIRQRGSSIIWDVQDANKLKTKTLALNCSADVTVDLWLF